MNDWNINDIVTLENKIKEELNCLVDHIYKELVSVKLNGVKKISSNICVVSVSCLQRGVLLPAFYIQEKQAEVVRDALKKCTTAHAFKKILEDMVSKKTATVGKYTYPLNSETVTVLNARLNELSQVECEIANFLKP